MTKEEFQQLAAAYGGDVTRWPAAQREEAAVLAAAEPVFAESVMTQESRLDATLDALPRAAVSAALVERIVAGAPPLRRRRRWTLWAAPAGLGAALAGIAAAGVVIGVQLGEHSALNAETSAQAVAALDVSSVSEAG